MSINNVLMPDGTELNFSQYLHWPMYSTIEIAAGNGINLDAFSYIVGQPVPHTTGLAARFATQLDTNLQRRRKMGQDESIIVHAITYEICTLSTVQNLDSPPLNVAVAPLTFATDLRRLQRDCVVELIVGAGIKKAQVGVPFSYIQQVIGPEIYTSGDGGAAPAAAIHLGQGGKITPRAQRQLNLPVFIGGFGETAKPGNSVYFVLRFRAPGGPPNGLLQNMAIRWWLDALKQRPG